MVRAEMLDKYGDSAYSDGFVVGQPRSIPNSSKLLRLPFKTVCSLMIKRHGFRGPLKHFDILEEANNDMEVHQVDNVISQEKTSTSH